MREAHAGPSGCWAWAQHTSVPGHPRACGLCEAVLAAATVLIRVSCWTLVGGYIQMSTQLGSPVDLNWFW